jgi:ketosteroid isomerase-like protein
MECSPKNPSDFSAFAGAGTVLAPQRRPIQGETEPRPEIGYACGAFSWHGMTPKLRITLILGGLTLTGFGCSGLSAPLSGIESVERARFAAMTRQDVNALEPMLADDLIYCHSNGRCENKSQLLESIRTGSIRYRAVDILSLTPRSAAGAVILNGSIAVDGTMDGLPIKMQMVYMAVYVRRDGRWRLAAWQAARLPVTH